MQGKSSKGGKKLAASPKYMSPSQLSLEGFETPFERNLNKNNRWVRLANAIPWDRIVPHYDRLFRCRIS
jgi:IS5 family transposase